MKHIETIERAVVLLVLAVAVAMAGFALLAPLFG